MTGDDRKLKIREFLALRFHGQVVSDDTDIFATGIVDSLFVVQLVMFVEQELGRTLDPADIELKHFSSISAIQQLMDAKSPATT